MKLRKRSREQRVAMVEASASGSDSDSASGDEWDPLDPLPILTTTRRNNAAAQTRRKLAPAMLETVLETLGRADLFDDSSLRNLRLVNKNLRDVVNATGALSSASFFLRGGNVGPLEAWASGVPAIQRTKYLFINNKVPPMVAGQLILTISSEKPPISKLELNGVGEAGEALLAAPFDQLQHLSVKKVSAQFNTMTMMLKNPSFVGLRSLYIDANGCLDPPTLAAALASFSHLQSLCLKCMFFEGATVQPGVLANALNSLETLKLGFFWGFDKTGLLAANGPAMPALRSLHVEPSVGDFQLEACPCLGHITELVLGKSAVVAGPATLAVLRGGPLERFSLSGATSYGACDWQDLYLPHLQSLDVNNSAADVLGDVAAANLPALRSAALTLGQQTSVDGIHAFSAAFPHLNDLTLWGHPEQEGEAIMKALKTTLVPHLESLTWSTHSSNPLTAVRSFLPRGTPSRAPRWRRLKSLHILILQPDMQTNAEQTRFYKALARAAPHCPNLTSLKAEVWYGAKAEAVEAFVEKAGELNAWPALRALGVNYSGVQRARSLRALRGGWPDAVVECTSPNTDLSY